MYKIKGYKREITAPALKHILGIDQLRYVFALWVIFTHNVRPPFFAGHPLTAKWELIDKLYGWCTNGEAAVIGFFIISGLCIHYPNIRRASVNLKSFYAARFLRLGLPLLAALGIAKLVNYQHEYGLIHSVPIWSLYCEGIYYIVYPAVLWFIKKGLLMHLTLASALLSLSLMIIWYKHRTESMAFHDVGGEGFLYWQAALVSFPFWLLGTLIAERISCAEIVDKIRTRNTSIWLWRLGAVLLSIITFPLYRIGLYFHYLEKPLLGLFFSSQFNIMLFGIYAFFWIEKEVVLSSFNIITPSPFLERMGLASYSLYLVHTTVIWAITLVPGQYFPGHMAYWLLSLLAIHLAMKVFYVAIEKPSHKISKYCGAVLRGNNT